jgi:hypothetical protein
VNSFVPLTTLCPLLGEVFTVEVALDLRELNALVKERKEVKIKNKK